MCDKNVCYPTPVVQFVQFKFAHGTSSSLYHKITDKHCIAILHVWYNLNVQL